jgi:hypothetical protein
MKTFQRQNSFIPYNQYNHPSITVTQHKETTEGSISENDENFKTIQPEVKWYERLNGSNKFGSMRYQSPSEKDVNLFLRQYQNLQPRKRQIWALSPQTKTHKKLTVALSSKILKLRKNSRRLKRWTRSRQTIGSDIYRYLPY